MQGAPGENGCFFDILSTIWQPGWSRSPLSSAEITACPKVLLWSSSCTMCPPSLCVTCGYEGDAHADSCLVGQSWGPWEEEVKLKCLGIPL